MSDMNRSGKRSAHIALAVTAALCTGGAWFAVGNKAPTGGWDPNSSQAAVVGRPALDTAPEPPATPTPDQPAEPSSPAEGETPAPPAPTPTAEPTATQPPAPPPPAPEPTKTKPPKPGGAQPDLAVYLSGVHQGINAERAEGGLGALKRDSCADKFAQSWAENLASRNALGHQPLDPIIRECQARTAGENAAMGTTNAGQAVQMWMNSSGHKQNILTGAFTRTGLGAAKASDGRWTTIQVFLG